MITLEVYLAAPLSGPSREEGGKRGTFATGICLDLTTWDWALGWKSKLGLGLLDWPMLGISLLPHCHWDFLLFQCWEWGSVPLPSSGPSEITNFKGKDGILIYAILLAIFNQVRYRSMYSTNWVLNWAMLIGYHLLKTSSSVDCLQCIEKTHFLVLFIKNKLLRDKLLASEYNSQV